MKLDQYSTLYHIDGKGKCRVWWMEVLGDKYRSISGIENGELIMTEWTVAHPKNTGKKNATTGAQQAVAEVKAQYEKKLARKYHKDREAVGSVKFTAPMLARKFRDEQTKLKWPMLAQPKFDGFRCIAKADGLWTREGKPFVSVPHIHKALEPVFTKYPDLIIDGELYNHDLHDDFDELSSILRKGKPTAEDAARSKQHIQYHVYDLIVDEDATTRRKMLADRVHALTDGNVIKLVRTEIVDSLAAADKFYESVLAAKYEGMMLRTPNGPYEANKRSKHLIKRKEFFDEEFPVILIKAGNGNWADCAASVTCKDTKTGETFDAGIKASKAHCKLLLSDFMSGKMPEYATVRFPNRTPSGVPRFGKAVDFHFGGKRKD